MSPASKIQSLFVSGTDTEIGKTWVAVRLLTALRTAGHRVGAWKPVCSGSIEQNGQHVWEDVQALMEAVTGEEQPADSELDQRLCPQRFHAALAANIAARLEGTNVSDAQLAEGLRAWHGHADYVVVEGAGGLLSPVSDTMLGADLAARLQLPIVLVAPNRLGVIHQTLATVESAAGRNLSVRAVILNEATSGSSDVLKKNNASELRRLLPDILLMETNWKQATPFEAADILEWFHTGEGSSSAP